MASDSMEHIRKAMERIAARRRGNPDQPGEGQEEAPCPICKGAGWIRTNAPLGSEGFGGMEPCECTLKEMERTKVERLLRYSNLGHLAERTFAGVEVDGRSPASQNQQLFREALVHAMEFAEEPRGWLVLTGPSGCGKTHLAAAIANRSIELGRRALYTVVPQMLDGLRAAYDAEEVGESYDSLMGRLQGDPLLILDELDSVKMNLTPWAREKLFLLLNHRFAAGLPTVVTVTLLETLDEHLQTRLADKALSRVCPLARAVYDRLEGLPPAQMLETMRFGDYIQMSRKATPQQQRSFSAVVGAAIAFADEPSGWLVLMGPTGSGKTHLAVAVVNALRERESPVFFARAEDLLDYLRASYDQNSLVSYDKRFDEVRNAPVLVLDDLGGHQSTPWAEAKLHQLLTHRYDARLPTVITVTSAFTGERHQLSEPHYSLLRAHTTMGFTIDMPDYRQHPAPGDGQ